MLSTLYVVATPIGNLEDLSPRASRTLRDVPLIAAEDTRHSRRLLTHFGIGTPLMSYHEHNARERRDQLMKALDAGDVALISDAGTPAVSDPGADLVAAALAAGHRVSPVPGPSALAAAVSASGLIGGPFISLGFLPRETGKRRQLVARAAASGFPLVLFEAAQRLGRLLSELDAALGDRQAVVLRELTKVHEEVRSGSLGELRGWVETANPRGEIVLVVAGTPDAAGAEDEVRSLLRTLRRSGLTASQAAREAAVMTGLPRSDLYDLAVEIGSGASAGLEGELPLSNQNALEKSLRDQEGP